MKKSLFFIGITLLFCKNIVTAQVNPVVMFDPIAVSAFAGSGTAGIAIGTGTAAQFYNPSGITIDATGNLYVPNHFIDYTPNNYHNYNSIRRITTPGAVVTTLAGGSGNGAYNPPQAINGTGAAAEFRGPLDAETDAAGNIYVLDNIYGITGGDDVFIRKVTPAGVVTSIWKNTDFSTSYNITALAVSSTGTVYVAYTDGFKYGIINASANTLVFDGGGIYNAPPYSFGVTKFTVDAQGNFLIANGPRNKIQKLSGGTLTTFAGTEVNGYSGDGGLAIAADIANPVDIDIDALGNTYILTDNKIRKISPAGYITGIAGSPNFPSTGYANGIGVNASFNTPRGLKINAEGNTIYVADAGNQRIRKVAVPVLYQFLAVEGTASAVQFFNVSAQSLNGNATVTAPAGYEVSLSTGSGYAQSLDLASIIFSGSGYVKSTQIYLRIAAATPLGNYNGDITITAAGATTATLAVEGSVTFNGLPCPDIRNPLVMFDPIAVSTFAGSGTAGFADGIGAAAQFYYPGAITTDVAGNLYMPHFYGSSIRHISPGAVVTTIAGGGSAGFVDGTGAAAHFNGPIDASTDAAGNIYNVDLYNTAIRKTTPAGVVTTFYQSSQPYINSIAIGKNDEVYFSYSDPNSFSYQIYKVTAAGILTEIYNGGDYRATGFTIARFTVDASGNFYISNADYNKVYKLSSSGLLLTIGGTGVRANSGDGGPALSADIVGPSDIDIDSLGNIYLATDSRIRKISPAGIITTLAGSSAGYADGIGANALFNWGSGFGLKVNNSGSLIYVADGSNHRIRKMLVPVLIPFSTTSNTASATQFFNISAEYLNGNAAITAPAGFEISLSVNSGYAQSLSLPSFIACGAGYIASTKIYIRIAAATQPGTYTGDVTLTATGAPSQTMAVTGTVTCLAPTIPTLSSSSNNNCGLVNTTLSITAGSLNSAAYWSWYTGSCGGTLMGTGTSIVVTPASTTTYYARAEGGCVVPGSCSSISITANPVVVNTISITSSATTICSGSYVSFNASAPNAGFNPVTYRWKKNGVVVQTINFNFPSSTIFNTSFYDTYNLANNDIITCEVTSSTACATPVTAVSNAITMTVNPTFNTSVSIAITSGTNPNCSGDPLTFTATQSNGGATPTYEWHLITGFPSSNTVVGANSPTFTLQNPAHNDVVYCDMTSSIGCSSPVVASSNSITVKAPTVLSGYINCNSNCNGSAGVSTCGAATIQFSAISWNIINSFYYTNNSPSYQW